MGDWIQRAGLSADNQQLVVVVSGHPFLRGLVTLTEKHAGEEEEKVLVTSHNTVSVVSYLPEERWGHLGSIQLNGPSWRRRGASAFRVGSGATWSGLNLNSVTLAV